MISFSLTINKINKYKLLNSRKDNVNNNKKRFYKKDSESSSKKLLRKIFLPNLLIENIIEIVLEDLAKIYIYEQKKEGRFEFYIFPSIVY